MKTLIKVGAYYERMEDAEEREKLKNILGDNYAEDNTTYEIIETVINIDHIATYCAFEDGKTSLMINGETMVLDMRREELDEIMKRHGFVIKF